MDFQLSDCFDEVLLRPGPGLRLISTRLAFPEILRTGVTMSGEDDLTTPKLKSHSSFGSTCGSLGGTVGGLCGGLSITMCLYLYSP